MAWTTPRTWVTSEVVTASVMNTHVRDNLNETAPANASASGGFIFATALNTVATRAIASDSVSTSQTTTSTSYTNLATTGPSVTITTGTAVVVALNALMSNNSAGQTSYMSVDTSGATTLAASDAYCVAYESGAASDQIIHSGVFLLGMTAGSNTYTAKYRVTGGTGTFQYRRMAIIPAQ